MTARERVADLQADTDALTDADIAERLRYEQEYLAYLMDAEQEQRERGRWL